MDTRWPRCACPVAQYSSIGMTCVRDVAVRYAEMTIKKSENPVVACPTNETARHRQNLESSGPDFLDRHSASTQHS
jgi:hypothetical protein